MFNTRKDADLRKKFNVENQEHFQRFDEEINNYAKSYFFNMLKKLFDDNPDLDFVRLIFQNHRFTEFQYSIDQMELVNSFEKCVSDIEVKPLDHRYFTNIPIDTKKHFEKNEDIFYLLLKRYFDNFVAKNGLKHLGNSNTKKMINKHVFLFDRNLQIKFYDSKDKKFYDLK